MNPKPTKSLRRCPRCSAVMLGAAAGLRPGKCPFCVPRPNTRTFSPAGGFGPAR